jgi:hypothetical protein
MSAPGWLRWALAVAMLAVAGYHLARLALVRLHRDVELGHAAMGAAMVMMLVAAPSGPWNRDLALAFAAATAWFGARSARGYVLDGPGASGLLVGPMVGSAAMAYMLAGPSHMSSMTGISSPSAAPASTLLIVAVAGSAAITLRRSASGTDLRLGPAPPQLAARRAAGRPRPDPPRHRVLAVGCGLAVNLTTVYMLVTM